MKIFFFQDLVFVYQHHQFPGKTFIDILTPTLDLIRRIDLVADECILRPGTSNEEGDWNTGDEAEEVTLPFHVGFNRFSDFLPLDSWNDYLKHKARLNEPEDVSSYL